MARGSYYSKYLKNNPESRAEKKTPFKLPEHLREAFSEGMVLLIDKPLHWTSFDVVRKIRNTIGIKKVGHAGTLDPLASGLLLICTGKFTKRINELMGLNKTYTGKFTLGATTPTYDLESTPENVQSIAHISADDLNRVAKTFLGNILQVPPVFSAIKKEGTPLYELARRGESVNPEPRPVTIYAFTITNWEPPVVEVEIECSTGTYIRSLAHDFGQALGCGAYLSALRRTRIGEYAVENAETPEAFIARLQKAAAKTDS